MIIGTYRRSRVEEKCSTLLIAAKIAAALTRSHHYLYRKTKHAVEALNEGCRILQRYSLH